MLLTNSFLNSKSSGEGPSLVARELALELGDGAFRPTGAHHIPGIANVVADSFSRKFSPEGCFEGLPSGLAPSTCDAAIVLRR